MRIVAIAFLLAGAAVAHADGCYICDGGAYVKFQGEDSWAKRHKAEGCGCKVQGNTSTCGAAHHKILCSVAERETGPRSAAPTSSRR